MASKMEEDNISGVLRDLTNSFTCDVCQDLINRPHIFGPCGHSFCFACIESIDVIDREMGLTKCPSCRGPRFDITVPNLKLQDVALEFTKLQRLGPKVVDVLQEKQKPEYCLAVATSMTKQCMPVLGFTDLPVWDLSDLCLFDHTVGNAVFLKQLTVATCLRRLVDGSLTDAPALKQKEIAAVASKYELDKNPDEDVVRTLLSNLLSSLMKSVSVYLLDTVAYLQCFERRNKISSISEMTTKKRTRQIASMNGKWKATALLCAALKEHPGLFDAMRQEFNLARYRYFALTDPDDDPHCPFVIEKTERAIVINWVEGNKELREQFMTYMKNFNYYDTVIKSHWRALKTQQPFIYKCDDGMYKCKTTIGNKEDVKYQILRDYVRDADLQTVCGSTSFATGIGPVENNRSARTVNSLTILLVKILNMITDALVMAPTVAKRIRKEVKRKDTILSKPIITVLEKFFNIFSYMPNVVITEGYKHLMDCAVSKTSLPVGVEETAINGLFYTFQRLDKTFREHRLLPTVEDYSQVWDVPVYKTVRTAKETLSFDLIDEDGDRSQNTNASKMSLRKRPNSGITYEDSDEEDGPGPSRRRREDDHLSSNDDTAMGDDDDSIADDDESSNMASFLPIAIARLRGMLREVESDSENFTRLTGRNLNEVSAPPAADRQSDGTAASSSSARQTAIVPPILCTEAIEGTVSLQPGQISVPRDPSQIEVRDSATQQQHNSPPTPVQDEMEGEGATEELVVLHLEPVTPTPSPLTPHSDLVVMGPFVTDTPKSPSPPPQSSASPRPHDDDVLPVQSRDEPCPDNLPSSSATNSNFDTVKACHVPIIRIDTKIIYPDNQQQLPSTEESSATTVAQQEAAACASSSTLSVECSSGVVSEISNRPAASNTAPPSQGGRNSEVEEMLREEFPVLYFPELDLRTGDIISNSFIAKWFLDNPRALQDVEDALNCVVDCPNKDKKVFLYNLLFSVTGFLLCVKLLKKLFENCSRLSDSDEVKVRTLFYTLGSAPYCVEQANTRWREFTLKAVNGFKATDAVDAEMLANIGQVILPHIHRSDQ